MANYLRRLGHRGRSHQHEQAISRSCRRSCWTPASERSRAWGSSSTRSWARTSRRPRCSPTWSSRPTATSTSGCRTTAATARICAEQCPLARHHPRQEDALQRLLHLEAQQRRPAPTSTCSTRKAASAAAAPRSARGTGRTWRPRDFAEWDGSLEWLHGTVDEQRERLMANDFVDPAERTDKWWFSLDEVDGELVVPDGQEPAEDLPGVPAAAVGRLGSRGGRRSRPAARPGVSGRAAPSAETFSRHLRLAREARPARW